MKTKLVSAIMVMAILFAAVPAMSQPGKDCKQHNHSGIEGKAHNCALPGLTDDQVKQIDQLKLKHLKEILPLQNTLKEKQARLRTLETAEKADMAAINKTIDEMAVLRADIMKKKASHHQEVRKLLTEEQRIVFDTRGPGHKKQGPKGKHAGPCCPK
jgi:Spy/CpxP family protein refolding chaperone